MSQRKSRLSKAQERLFYRLGRAAKRRIAQRCVACTECGAMIGKSCKTINGGERVSNHRERINAASRAGIK